MRNPPTPDTSTLMSIEQLLGFKFAIPSYQRPYDWEDRHVKALLNDLNETRADGYTLFLGLVVAVWDEASQSLQLIDGQQRLTTVMLALGCAPALKPRIYDPTRPEGRGRLWVDPRSEDRRWVANLLSGSEDVEASTLSQHRLAMAFRLLSATDAVPITHLLQGTVILHVVSETSRGPGMFERINQRGKRVSNFDLVKNKIIEWAGAIKSKRDRLALLETVKQRYDQMYKAMNPPHVGTHYDGDKLLRIHWILNSGATFKSGDDVQTQLHADFLETKKAGDKAVYTFLEKYADSLEQVCDKWVLLQTPYLSATKKFRDSELYAALCDFKILGRPAEFEPLIIAAMICMPSQAHFVVRICEILSFREAMAGEYTNHERSMKWKFAQRLHQGTLRFGDKRITAANDLAHALFWEIGVWWDRAEAAESKWDEVVEAQDTAAAGFDLTNFYGDRYPLLRYLFWTYGRYLEQDASEYQAWGPTVRGEASQFTYESWFNGTTSSFAKWDVDHIFPRRPDFTQAENRAAASNHAKDMKYYLNSIGNLTLLTQPDNRSWKNVDFKVKREKLRQLARTPFNSLLSESGYIGKLTSGPYWGPNNCRRRRDHIARFAGKRFGWPAIQQLGVRPYDGRELADD